MLPQICYNTGMKKMTKKVVIKLLKNRTHTYNELARLTGYHEKSLIRLNKTINAEHYKLKDYSSIYRSIIKDFNTSDFTTYKEFYNSRKDKYNFKYSTICKILNSTILNDEIVFIEKVKTKGSYYFNIIDNNSRALLFKFPSLKNDTKSLKNILYKILCYYGSPKKLSLTNFLKNLPSEIKTLCAKYNIKIIPYKSIYRNVLKNTSTSNAKVKYANAEISKEDFYECTIRKCIAINCIQYKCVRYRIKTKKNINKNEVVFLYHYKDDLFIIYEDQKYEITPYKKTTSKKGITKY